MDSEKNKESVGEWMKRKTLRTGIKMILEIIPVRDLLQRGFDQIGDVLMAMGRSLQSHELEPDELKTMALVEFTPMPDGTMKVMMHRVTQLQGDENDTAGEIKVRFKEATSVNRKISEAMALNIPEEEMVASLVDTISGQRKALPSFDAPATEPLRIAHTTTDALGETHPDHGRID